MTEWPFLGYRDLAFKKGFLMQTIIKAIHYGVATVFAAFLMVQSASGGVFDDVAAWWHFDYDADSDNKADVGEIKDQRAWDGSAKHASSVSGPVGSPQWTSAEGNPSGGVLYGGKSMLFSPTTSGAACWPATFKVNGFGAPGSATLVMRLRWDGLAVGSETWTQIYFNGFDWANSGGWVFGLLNGVPYHYTRKGNLTGLGTALTVGQWYDLAVVLTDNGVTDTVTCYLWPDGGSPTKVTKSGDVVPSNAGAYTQFGCEFQYGGLTDTANARRAFKGAINHTAIWTRALSEGEVYEALRATHPATFRIGLDNGSLNDLRAEYETTDEYAVNAPWHTMRRALTTARRTVTIKAPMTALQAQMDQVVHVDTTTGGSLTLIVNSTTNEVKATGADKQISWFIPAEQFVTGTNSVTLRYDGASWIGIDCVEIGGTWQVGVADNNYAEFEAESLAPDDFYITNPNLKALERAVVIGGEKDINLLFPLSAELAGNYAFTYTTRLINQGGGDDAHMLQVLVNDTVVQSLPGQPNGTTVTVRIDPEYLQAGQNKLTLRYNDAATGWILFDYHRLEVRERLGGTLIRVY